MSGHEHLRAIFVLVLLSVTAPVLAVRARLPAAVVLILVGLAFGPAGLALVSDTPPVALLSELGFLVLMFVAGMEIDFESLRAAGARALAVPVLAVLGFIGVAGIFGIALNLSVMELLVVSASSVGMPLAVLQETGQLQKPLGRFVLLTSSLGEFVSILAIIGYEVFAEEGTLGMRALKLFKVLLLFVVSMLLIRWARAAVWWRPEPLRRLTRHHDVAELGVRTGLLVMFAFVVIAATLGVEPILGAFIAGALVAFVLREKSVLESKIAALGHGLFIPIFFIVIGVRFDPGVLDVPALKAAGVLIGIITAVKIVPSLIVAPSELGLRERLAAGCLLAAPLTLLVAIASIGSRLHAITPTQEATFLLLALVLSIGFPIVFRLLAGGGGQAAGAPAGHAAAPGHGAAAGQAPAPSGERASAPPAS
jgi:Kef-type K+ transport system membrane component KefB